MFRGRLSEYERDEILFRIIEQLDMMHDRLDKVEARVKQSTYNLLGSRRVEKPQDNCNENQKEQI